LTILKDSFDDGSRLQKRISSNLGQCLALRFVTP
jgi:hypothetical protein